MQTELLERFEGKKWVIILAEPHAISAYDLAYTAALIGFQWGRKIPGMVGRAQQVPGSTAIREHAGITTQNLPVLNGLSFDHMRSIREALRQDSDLLVTEITDAAATSQSYGHYTQTIATTASSNINYWGIGIFGDSAKIQQYTEGLKLYAKQPKLSSSALTFLPRLRDPQARHLPTVQLILANNLSGGVLANTAAILGISLGKLYGDAVFGADFLNQQGETILGLPIIDLILLNGYSASNSTLRSLREQLHEAPELSVVDVSDATGRTRSYEEYLAVTENTPVQETQYWGLGIGGSASLMAVQTASLRPYISSAEEQELLKKQEAARKFEQRKAAAKSI